MKIIAFAGSNSNNSINHQLVTCLSTLSDNIEVVSLRDLIVPMYGIDAENEEGIPSSIISLSEKISNSDAIIISVAEHNGNVTAYYKSVTDWLSRQNRSYMEGKKVVVLSTSPGKGGAKSALEIASKSLPHFGAEVVGTKSVPSFNDVVQDGNILDEIILEEMKTLIGLLKS